MSRFDNAHKIAWLSVCNKLSEDARIHALWLKNATQRRLATTHNALYRVRSGEAVES